MKTILLAIVLFAGCTSDKPVEWFPRVTAWKNEATCEEVNQPTSLRISQRELEFCRVGSGFILSIGRNT